VVNAQFNARETGDPELPFTVSSVLIETEPEEPAPTPEPTATPTPTPVPAEPDDEQPENFLEKDISRCTGHNAPVTNDLYLGLRFVCPSP
jgi:hypothetical protein